VISSVCQRWRSGRASYRPAREVVDTRRLEVATIDRDTVARAFVVEHHYSASYPAARFRFGLYQGGDLVGVAVFSVPANYAALACLPCPTAEATELGRLVLLDHVKANAESWFIARCFEDLRRLGIAGVISFSDPVPRQDTAGTTVFRGHVGTVYQASNAIYLGRSRASSLRLLPDGSVLHNRALAKLRGGECGRRYVAAQIERASGIAVVGDVDTWLTTWLPRITRRLPHGGNHKYAFAIDRRIRRYMPESQTYPKFDLGRAITGLRGASEDAEQVAQTAIELAEGALR
jgi:hypothetical protein